MSTKKKRAKLSAEERYCRDRDEENFFCMLCERRLREGRQHYCFECSIYLHTEIEALKKKRASLWGRDVGFVDASSDTPPPWAATLEMIDRDLERGLIYKMIRSGSVAVLEP